MTERARLIPGEDYVATVSDDSYVIVKLHGKWIEGATALSGYHSFYETRKGRWYSRDPEGVICPEDDLPTLEDRNEFHFLGEGWSARGCNPGGTEYTDWIGYGPFLTEDGALESAMVEYEE